MRISIRSPRYMARNTQPLKPKPNNVPLMQPLCNLIDAVAVKSVLIGPRNIRENGIHRFIENATVVCICFQTGEQLSVWCPNASQAPDLGTVKTYVGSEVPPEIQKAVATGARFIAHNCELERAVFRKIGIPETAVSQWFDTSAMARAWMLPDDLQRLGASLDLPASAPCESTIANASVDDPAIRRIAMSGISEVVLVGAVAVRLNCLLPDLSQSQIEKKFHDKHLEINERGIQIDLALVTAAARIAEMELVVTDRKIQRITAGIVTLSKLRNSNPDSASSLLAILKRQYQYELPSCDEDAIFEVLAQLRVNVSDNRAERRRKRTIRAILFARLRVASTGIGKLDSILNQTSADGRLRGQYTYYGCHTGRSSSRGVQLQNLSRPKEGVDVLRSRLAVHAYGLAIKNDRRQAADEFLQTLRDAAGARGTPAAIAACVATTLVAAEGHRLILADACQIENRLLYWLSNDSANVMLYRDFDAGIGKDPYCASAEKLRGERVAGKNENPSAADKDWRKVGKTCEISLGYQMGVISFAKRCQAEGTDIARVGLTPDRCVSSWRRDHPNVAGRSGIWRNLEIGIETVIKERVARHWPVDGTQIHIFMHNRDLLVGLPSGRHLIYRNARMAPSEKFPLHHHATYDSTTGPRQLYGGLITENIVQAIAADCFRFWILEAERAGLKVIGHTHDEIILEALEGEAQSAFDLSKRLMKIAPPWAPSLPVNAEGEVHAHYKK